MKFRTEKRHIMAMGMGLLILLVDIAMFYGTAWFIPLIIVAITLGWSQYWIDFFTDIQKQRNIEERFPDFVRYLVGAIKSGMPVSRAIIYVSKTDFGDLTPHVKKLANQLEWSIPVHKALTTFANDTKNPVIKRAISTVIEAEQAGGNIEDVLESVTQSVIEIKKMRQKRKANIHGQIIQSYVIFCVFLIVMIVVQNLVVPYVMSMSEEDLSQQEGGVISPLGGVVEDVNISFASVGEFIDSAGVWFVSLRGVFLMIALIQGLFTGIVIGKLAEGQVRPGIKHSLILMTMAFFVITLSQGI
ncbi:MAG: type II secretion system F family protein [Candidatus Woesearchaeota archaeon]